MNKKEKAFLLGLLIVTALVTVGAGPHPDSFDVNIGNAVDTCSAKKEQPIWQDCNAPSYIPTQADVDAIAKLLYGEALNCNVEGQAAVVWCILNRVDSDDPYFPDTIMEVVTQPNQFFGYREDNPVLPELVAVADDVLMRYGEERSGAEDVGRVLPREYLYFSGDGFRNYFTVTYCTNDVWDWSAYNPYTE